jgi:hypothetical protein
VLARRNVDEVQRRELRYVSSTNRCVTGCTEVLIVLVMTTMIEDTSWW